MEDSRIQAAVPRDRIRPCLDASKYAVRSDYQAGIPET